jgi:hypothetical protein
VSKDEQEAVKLDYGSKLYSALTDSGQRADKAYFRSLLLATALLLFSAGTIRIEHGFAVLGLSVLVDVPQLLGFGALAVALFHLYALCLGFDQDHRHTDLLNTYASLNFNPARDPFFPSWTALLYADAVSVMTSAIHHGIYAPFALTPLINAVKELARQKKRPWGLLIRFSVASITIVVVLLLLLFLPILAEVWALVRAAQVLNGVDFWLILAAVVLLIVNAAIVLLAGHGIAEHLPETGAALERVVGPLMQDIETQSAVIASQDAAKSDEATEDVSAINSMN